MKKLTQKQMDNNNECLEEATGQNIVVMSQYDLVLTQWAFIGALLTHPRSTGFGIPDTCSLKAVIKQMYMIGKELGIDDEFNLCKGNIEDVIDYAKQIEGLIIKPALESKFNYHNMPDYMLKGAHLMNPFIDTIAFSRWSYKLFGADQNLSIQKSDFISCTSKILYSLQVLTFDYILFYETSRRMFIVVFNALMRFGIYMANYNRNYTLTKDGFSFEPVLLVKGLFDYIV